MIITKVRLQEEHPMTNGSVTWPLPACDLHLNSSAGQNGFLIKAASGFGPTDFLAVVDGFDSTGAPVMDSIAEKREIALKIGLVPGGGQSISHLRSEIYKYISRSVEISFMNDSEVVAKTSGFVQKIEAGHFSNIPEILIIIKCRTGDLYSPNTISVPTSLLVSSGASFSPIIPYSEGDAPTGFTLQFTYTKATSGTGFSITNYGRLWYEGTATSNVFTLSYTLLTNDIIKMTTQTGEKRIILTRGGINYDISGYINAGAVWPKLYPGVNYFTWDLSTTWLGSLSFTYTPRYWGV